MVLVHVKKSEAEQFLFQTETGQPVEAVIGLCVELRNLHSRLLRLCASIEEELGPASEEQSPALEEALRAAQKLCSPERVAEWACVTPGLLQDALTKLAGCCCGLAVAGLASKASNFCDLDSELGDFDPDTTEAWFAGKRLQRGKRLRDHVGSNEKTKVIVKLQEHGDMKPAREPALDEAGHRAMLAWQFQKQQERLAMEEDGDDFSTAGWADSRALKQDFVGIGGVRLQ